MRVRVIVFSRACVTSLCACVCVCGGVYVSDLGIVCVVEVQTKVVSLQQVQMATYHVQQGLAFGKFLTQKQRDKCGRRPSTRAVIYHTVGNNQRRYFNICV